MPVCVHPLAVGRVYLEERNNYKAECDQHIQEPAEEVLEGAVRGDEEVVVHTQACHNHTVQQDNAV